MDTFFAPTNKAIDGFLQWTQARNKTEEFGKILGNQTVAGAILAYHALPEFVYKFGILKEFDRKFINTALSDAVSDTTGAFALQIDEEGGSIFVKGTGSEVKVIGADNYACNGIIHLVDGVLLPFDANGELSEKQIERLEDAKEMLSEAIEEEEEEMEEEEEEEMEEGMAPAAPAPAPAPDAVFSIGLLTDLGSEAKRQLHLHRLPKFSKRLLTSSRTNLRSPAAAPEEDVVEPKKKKKTYSKPSWTKAFSTSPSPTTRRRRFQQQTKQQRPQAIKQRRAPTFFTPPCFSQRYSSYYFLKCQTRYLFFTQKQSETIKAVGAKRQPHVLSSLFFVSFVHFFFLCFATLFCAPQKYTHTHTSPWSTPRKRTRRKYQR